VNYLRENYFFVLFLVKGFYGDLKDDIDATIIPKAVMIYFSFSFRFHYQKEQHWH